MVEIRRMIVLHTGVCNMHEYHDLVGGMVGSMGGVVWEQGVAGCTQSYDQVGGSQDHSRIRADSTLLLGLK